MSTYSIQINDDVITEQVGSIINTVVNREIRNRYSPSGREIADAVRELIYSQKDTIIEMVVDRATREIVKKGLPKLLERFD